jgi:hypothetical protein
MMCSEERERLKKLRAAKIASYLLINAMAQHEYKMKYDPEYKAEYEKFKTEGIKKIIEEKGLT